jgi:hypothetical protein
VSVERGCVSAISSNGWGPADRHAGGTRRDASWVKPELVVGVRHLGGSRALRHATVQDVRDD